MTELILQAAAAERAERLPGLPRKNSMNDQPNHEGSQPLETNTRLAYERTYLAHERTQMAWVRTSLAFISFGFTIAKFFQYLQEKEPERAPFLGPRTIGVLMIVMGVVTLMIADVQHRRAMRAMRKACPDLAFPLAGLTGLVLAGMGILALIGAILRQ